MSVLITVSGILALGLLAYLVAQAAVVQSRLNARIHRTLSPAGERRATTRRFLRLASFARFLSTRNERKTLTLRLQRAGFFDDKAVDLFLLARTGWVVVLWLVSIVFMAPEDLGALLTAKAILLQLAAVLLASRLSEWWLNGRIKSRTARVRHRISEALELLTICVGSGLTMEQTLKQVAKEIRAAAPELAVELDRLYSEFSIMEDRQAVLTRFAQHTAIQELQVMARTLLQSMQFGTPLVDALQTVADQSRLAQLADIKERAGAAPARMSIPLVVFILFPVIGLLGAPAVVHLVRSMQAIGS